MSKIKITEFSEKYPHYKRGFFAYNKPTETEELLGMRMSSLTYSSSRQKEYQEFSLEKETFKLLSQLFKEKDRAKGFFMDINHSNNEHLTKRIYFVGIKRNKAIYALCTETKERVLFTCNFFSDDMEEDYSDLEGLEPYDLC